MLTVVECRVITATLHTGEALPEPMQNELRSGWILQGLVGQAFSGPGSATDEKTGTDADGISAQNANRERADLIATERALPTAEK